MSSVTVSGNASITGDRDGVEIDSLAGSDSGIADRNLSSVTVNGNGDITGLADGVVIGAFVNDDPANTIDIDVSENKGTISSAAGDGIDINGADLGGAVDAFLCCDSQNTITIENNKGGVIQGGPGGTDHGIELSVCGEVQVGPTSDTDCLNNSTTLGTRTNHDNSGPDRPGMDA